MDQSRESPWLADLLRSARRVSAGLWAGLIAGFVFGGIGGRLAMYALRLTSDPSLLGFLTDDGFVIGQFTAATGFLVLLTTATGAVGGLFYLLVRTWLPERFRPAVMAILGAGIGGSAIIRPDGFDFSALEPAWLAVGLFVALPAVYGLSLSVLAERLLASRTIRPGFGWLLISLLPIALLAVAGLIGLGLIVAGAVGWILNRRLPLARLWNSTPVAWLGRTALLALALSSFIALTRDALEIL